MKTIELLQEYTIPWNERKVVNPITGNLVKIKSLPPELQNKYKPAHVRKEDAAKKAPTQDGMTDTEKKEQKLVFDFYVYVPEEYESVEDYIEAKGNAIPATISSTVVVETFPKDGYIIKFKHTPMEAVTHYLDWDNIEDKESFKDAEFKEMPETVDKRFKFMKYNTFTIFTLAPKDYLEDITILNDTPDDDGTVEKESETVKESIDMSLLKKLDLINESPKLDEATRALLAYEDNIPEVFTRITQAVTVMKAVMDNNPIGTMIENGMIDGNNSAKTKAEYELIYTQLTTAASSINETTDRLNALVAGLKANEKIEQESKEPEEKAPIKKPSSMEQLDKKAEEKEDA